MITILFAILNLIPFISNLLNIFIRLFTVNFIFLKLLYIILLPIIYCILRLCGKRKRLKLSHLRTLKYGSYLKYKIHDNNELDITISLLLLHFIFFIYLILVSRIKNIQKTLDLASYFNEFLGFYNNSSSFHFCINIILVIYVIIYILLISQLIKIARFHFMKLYLYTVSFLNKNSHITRLQIYVVHDNPLDSFLNKLNLHEGTDFSLFVKKFIYHHIEGLKLIIHRLILVTVIFYDILFNDLILPHMFKILPYIFLYELWVKVYIFMSRLNIPYDEVVALLLYTEKYTLDYDPDCIYIDDKPYEKAFIKELLTQYVRAGFIDKYFIEKYSMPENPIIRNLKLIVDFWKPYILKSTKKLMEFLISKK